jgi:hypothetical protein
MAVAAEVVAVRDLNDDQEVGGQDLPATVILKTDSEDTAAVADMVREGKGLARLAGSQRLAFVWKRQDAFDSRRSMWSTSASSSPGAAR